MRAYLPITLDALATNPVVSAAKWPVPAGVAHVVTPQLRAQFPNADDEELEWEAFNAAADDSLALSLHNQQAIPLRAVLSVDLPPGSVTQFSAGASSVPSRGQVVAGVGADVAALHVDEADVGGVISAARAGGQLTSAQQNALNDAHLLWYHPNEIKQLVTDMHAQFGST